MEPTNHSFTIGSIGILYAFHNEIQIPVSKLELNYCGGFEIHYI